MSQLRPLNWNFFEPYFRLSVSELSYGQVSRLLRTLGWLARWWLDPDLLQRVAHEQPGYQLYSQRPTLPTQPGSCWAIFVRQEQVPCLRPAFLLPLRWQADSGNDPGLPPALAELASCIRQQCRDEQQRCWGLHLARPASEAPVDLSGLDLAALEAGSAWAALTGGLLLGRDGLSPNPRVWASVAEDAEFGIAAVAGVAEKLDLAASWGAERVFLPAQNQPQISQWQAPARSNLAIELLAPQRGNVSTARLLEAYLEQLGAVPSSDASLDVMLRYYRRVNRRTATQFVWDRLQEAIVAQCRQALPADCRPTHLITVVSTELTLVALAPAVLQVQRCLLLCLGKPTAAICEVLDQLEPYLTRAGIVTQRATIEAEMFHQRRQATRDVLTEFLNGTTPNKVAFDLTPGPKSITLALESAAPPGAWLVYCRHRTGPPDNRAEPLSQRFDCWRKGE